MLVLLLRLVFMFLRFGRVFSHVLLTMPQIKKFGL